VLVDVARGLQLGADPAQRQTLPCLRACPVQPLGERHGFRVELGVRLAALALAPCPAHALPRALELGDEGRFLELSDGAEDLAHHRAFDHAESDYEASHMQASGQRPVPRTAVDQRAFSVKLSSGLRGAGQ
jgi:hypothetical protein